MAEICQNCGDPKKYHPDMSQFLGKATGNDLIEKMSIEFRRAFDLYANVCLNYKRDNLKYLEDLTYETKVGKPKDQLNKFIQKCITKKLEK